MWNFHLMLLPEMLKQSHPEIKARGPPTPVLQQLKLPKGAQYTLRHGILLQEPNVPLSRLHLRPLCTSVQGLT
jgi:hypothetical protein